jgi:ankyrin repeat protein
MIAKRIVAGGSLVGLLSVGIMAAPNDTRLADAVKARDVDTVRALLKQHVDVNAAAPDGATALHWAAQWDDIDLADLLIKSHAQVDATDVYGVTPLIMAAINGSGAMITRLLDAGANPNLALPNGETPLMNAARSGKLDAVRPLLKRGAKVDAVESVRGQNAIMWAAAEGHTAVVKTLLEAGAEVSSRSKSGYTPLLFAGQRGDEATTKVLLDAGADVNEAASNGTTALVLATSNEHIDYAEFLLSRNADPKLGPGYTALHLAAGEEGFVEGEEGGREGGSLWGPAKEEFIKLLLKHGADINAVATRAPKGVGTAGATPFWLAAWAADPDTMRFLVANGADPNKATPQGTTPLMVASGVMREAGGPNVPDARALVAVKLCVEWGNDVNAVNASLGDTALHGAAYRGIHGGAEITKFLLAKGAKVNVANKRGWTPLIVAQGLYFSTYNTTNDKTAELLRQAGATPPPPGLVTNTGIRSSEVWYAPGCEPATLGSEGKCTAN